MKNKWCKTIVVIGFLLFFLVPVPAGAVYINDVASFPAYDYNTYYDPPGYTIGCGPTTGAMILGYFENSYGASGLLDNGSGFDTAVALHGYLNTNSSGFGSPYDIKLGMEGYALNQGYDINVMVHVGTWNDPTSTDFDLYGAYGDGWNNDGIFWVDLGGGTYTFDPYDFYTFSVDKLNAGIAVWLAIDQDAAEGGDHWVPMIGVEWFEQLGEAEYKYYDTYSLSEQTAWVQYIDDTVGGGDQAISYVRTVEYLGPTGGPGPSIPEPATMFLLGTGLIGLAGLRRKFRKR